MPQNEVTAPNGVFQSFKIFLQAVSKAVKRFLVSEPGAHFWAFLYLLSVVCGCMFVFSTDYYKHHVKEGHAISAGRVIVAWTACSTFLVFPAYCVRRTSLMKWNPRYHWKTVGYAITLSLSLVAHLIQEKNDACVGVHLSMVVASLAMLELLHPATDLGFFNLFIGVVMSSTYTLHKLHYQTWVAFLMCLVLSLLKNWVDEEEGDEEERTPATSATPTPKQSPEHQN